MEFLHEYARGAKDRRVFLTIHQPSTFLWNTIDHVVLLSKGKLMYQGPRADMESFFDSAGHPTPVGWNPADHYVTVVNDEFRQHQLSVAEWARRFQAWRSRENSSTTSDDMSKAILSHSMVQSQDKAAQAMQRTTNPLTLAGELTYRYWLPVLSAS